MGISERDYYREEPPTGWTSTVSFCHGLIAVTAVIFFAQMLTRPADPFGRLHTSPLLEAFALDPAKVYAGEVWRLVTHLFMHSETNVFHVVFNMLLLFFVGKEVEERYGSKEFLAFYLSAGVAGGLAYLAGQAAGVTLAGPRAVGASGAVTGVLLLFALHNPFRVLLFFGVIPVPAWLFVAGSVGYDAVRLTTGSKENIAFAGHLGGALFGVLYFQFRWSLTAWLPSWPKRKAAAKRPALRVFQPDPSEPPPAVPPPVPRPEPEEHLEAKLDQVLEKMTRFGQASLSDQERQILFRASEVYKRRRKL